MVRTLCFPCGGTGSIPGWDIKIPQATQCSQKQKMDSQKGKKILLNQVLSCFELEKHGYLNYRIP